MSRTKTGRGDTKDRILEAAISVFSARGYHGATVQMIVFAADVNQAAVNYHFGGKARLYEEVMRTVAHRLIGQREEAFEAWQAADDPLRTMVLDLLRQTTADVEERQRLGRLFAWESLDPSGVPEVAPRVLMDGLFQAVRNVVMKETGASANDPGLDLDALWVLGQCTFFGRDHPPRDHLTPIPLEEEDAFTEMVARRIVPRIRAGLRMTGAA